MTTMDVESQKAIASVYTELLKACVMSASDLKDYILVNRRLCIMTITMCNAVWVEFTFVTNEIITDLSFHL